MNIKEMTMVNYPNNLMKITAVVDGDKKIISELIQDSLTHPYEMIIKKVSKRRSLDANAYAWVLIDKLAEKLGISKTEVYKECIRDIGGVSSIVCVKNEVVEQLIEGWMHNGLGWQADTFPSKLSGCTNVILYYGSSSYNTLQMSKLIDRLIIEAKEFGIETLTPQELISLKGYKGD